MKPEDIKEHVRKSAAQEVATLDHIISMIDDGESREAIRAALERRSEELWKIINTTGTDLPEELLPF